MSSFLNFGTGLGAAENAISLLFPKRRVRIGQGVSEEFLPPGAIELDASIEEIHEGESEIPRHPVETGADITDHVRRKPESVRITGIVTNTPILLGAFLGPARPFTPLSFTRAEEFYDTLRNIKDEAALITVVTTLRLYENMLLKSFRVPRNVGQGNVVEATMIFEEVIFVDTETITAIPVDPSAGAIGAKGKIAAPPNASAATAVQSQSVLAKGAAVASKFLGF